jgi:hypothetical protein
MMEEENNILRNSYSKMNLLRENLGLDLYFNSEQIEDLRLNGSILIKLNEEKTIKVTYSDFMENLVEMISDSLNIVIDNNSSNHLYCQLAAKKKVITLSELKQLFSDYCKKNKNESCHLDKKVKSFQVACDSGIYLRLCPELNSPISKDEICPEGILKYEQVFMSDYSLKINTRNEIGIEIETTRLHVIDDEGCSLGWTSLNNTSGEILVIDYLSHLTMTFKFIYDGDYKPRTVDWDNFRTNFVPELGIYKLDNELLKKGYIDICQTPGIISIEQITKIFKKCITNKKKLDMIEKNNIMKKDEEERKKKIKQYSEIVGVCSLFGSWMFYQNEVQSQNRSGNKVLSKRAISTGLKKISQVNTGIRKDILESVAEYVEQTDTTKEKMNISGNNGLISSVLISVLNKSGIGNIPGGEKFTDFTNNGEGDTEGNSNNETTETNENNNKHTTVNNQNFKEQENIQHVDNLLNLFREHNP